ncbi:MAG: exonuclease domain-containing protein [Spirochaetes bacterium]|nr:exonuclease domain-containing protein [Spirochaetota bacterium]
MSKNFWRIGISYVDLELFDKGLPYVWGDALTDWGYLEQLKNVKAGDIIVAGGTQKVRCIGEVLEKPVLMFPSKDSAFYAGYNIAEAAEPAHKKLIEAFRQHEYDTNDIVCIPVKWLDTGTAPLRMPTQERGVIIPLNHDGINWVAKLLGKSPPVEPAAPNANPVLSFTAIDFETGSGHRNSVCQVGLVKVVNGVIHETYSSLIRPPDNFISEHTFQVHGIYSRDTQFAPGFAESYKRWKHLVENQILVAHNMMGFDYGCLSACLSEFCGISADFKTYCTMKIWRGYFENASLDTCCRGAGIRLDNHHNALADAEACAKLFLLAVNKGMDLGGC